MQRRQPRGDPPNSSSPGVRADSENDTQHRQRAEPDTELCDVRRRGPSGTEVAVILLAAVGDTGGERAAAEVCVFNLTTV